MSRREMETVYYGKRLDMVAEVAAFDPTTIDVPAKDCRYLVLPTGELQYDTYWFATLAEAKAEVKELVSYYAGAKTCAV